MRSTRLKFRLAACYLLGALGCTPGAEPLPDAPTPEVTSAPVIDLSKPLGKPAKPLALAEPPAPSSEAAGQDLTKVDGDQLQSYAARFAAQGNNGEAARFQYWAVKGGAAGSYNLACWTALSGDVNGAFYWLQEAALDEGVDASWAEEDSDLVSLRSDPRWKQIAPYLKHCNDYWAVNGPRQTLLVLPEGYQKGTPIGVVIGLHGMGDQPAGYADPDRFQDFANELNMAIVGVSGTVAKGRSKFVWSEDAQLDARQVRRALDDVADRLTVKPGHLVVFGFSQGAQMGFEIAFRNPGEYKGAIVMSPGTGQPIGRLQRLKIVGANKNQGFVFLCGAGEHPGNVMITKEDAEFGQKAGSRVELKLYEGMKQHAFPPDFDASFVRWVRFVDGSGSESKVE